MKQTWQKPTEVSSEQLEKLMIYYIDRANELLRPRKLTFNLSPDQEDIFINLIKYFNDFEGRYDLCKDIFLSGEVGCGKTFVLELFRVSSPKKKFKFINAKWLANQYQLHGPIALKDIENKDLDVEIDDIGTEDIKKNYGTELNVMEYVVTTRYELWQRWQTRTHYTGNQNEKVFTGLYGERGWSRVHEQHNRILWPGKDRRRI